MINIQAGSLIGKLKGDKHRMLTSVVCYTAHVHVYDSYSVLRLPILMRLRLLKRQRIGVLAVGKYKQVSFEGSLAEV